MGEWTMKITKSEACEWIADKRFVCACMYACGVYLCGRQKIVLRLTKKRKKKKKEQRRIDQSCQSIECLILTNILVQTRINRWALKDKKPQEN